MTKTPKNKMALTQNQLPKCPTGIKGFDEITEGGLPKNMAIDIGYPERAAERSMLLATTTTIQAFAS